MFWFVSVIESCPDNDDGGDTFSFCLFVNQILALIWCWDQLSFIM